jgi:charged multivesicular body protein 6
LIGYSTFSKGQMGGRLGKSGASNAKAIDQAKIDQTILDLKVQRDHLKRYEAQQEHLQEQEHAQARALAKAGKREKAALVLKQKKLRQVYIDRARGQLQNIQQMIDAIESQQQELEIVESMRSANDVMKHLESLMPIEEIERLRDDLAEHHERVNEIQDLLAQDLTAQDNQAVEDEYEQMLAEIGEEEGGEEAADEVEEAPPRVAMPA